MPEMDGPATVAELQAVRPELPCVFITGGSWGYGEEELVRMSGRPILWKPFDVEGVLAVVTANLIAAPTT